MNETIAQIRRHRSIRKYKPDPIPREHILEAVRAGQAASTSSAVQSYCLIHITDQAKRDEIAELTGPQPKVANCGAFFIVCGDTRRHRLLCARDGRDYDARLEAFLLAVIDASLFAQNFSLALESLGYGMCYIGGLRNDLPRVDRLLDLPEGVYPLYGLCAGLPDETPLARPRLPVEAILHENGYATDEAALELIEKYDREYEAYMTARDGSPRRWSDVMAKKFSEPRRTSVGPYYTGKGADLS